MIWAADESTNAWDAECVDNVWRAEVTDVTWTDERFPCEKWSSHVVVVRGGLTEAQIIEIIEGILGIGESSRYIHTQSIASDTWTINHNLGRSVNVYVRNDAGQNVVVSIQETSLNQVIVTAAAPFSGVAVIL